MNIRVVPVFSSARAKKVNEDISYIVELVL